MKLQAYTTISNRAIPPDLWKSCGWTVHFLWTDGHRKVFSRWMCHFGGDRRCAGAFVARFACLWRVRAYNQ
jgi:hypothetical protein